jgi:hypothetical protein
MIASFAQRCIGVAIVLTLLPAGRCKHAIPFAKRMLCGRQAM